MLRATLHDRRRKKLMLDERLRIEDPQLYRGRWYQYLVTYKVGTRVRRFFGKTEEFEAAESRVVLASLPFPIKDEEALSKLEELLKNNFKGKDVVVESFSFFSE
jgi:hypothetical protein